MQVSACFQQLVVLTWVHASACLQYLKKGNAMRNLRRVLTFVLVLLLLGGAAGYWFLLRDTSAAKLALQSDRSVAARPSVADLTGTWAVVPGRGEEATI